MIDCTSAVRQLWDFIEQEIDDSNRKDVEQHLAFCKRCCGEVEFAEELREVLQDASAPSIPTEVAGRLSDFIDSIEEA